MIISSDKDQKMSKEIADYVISKDQHIHPIQIKDAILMNISQNNSYLCVSIDENQKINGVMFGYVMEDNSWSVQGFFFDSLKIAKELAIYTFNKLNQPKLITYRKFDQIKDFKWTDDKIKKYIEIIN